MMECLQFRTVRALRQPSCEHVTAPRSCEQGFRCSNGNTGAYTDADIIQAQNELLQVTLAKLPQTSLLEPDHKQELSILRREEGQ